MCTRGSWTALPLAAAQANRQGHGSHGSAAVDGFAHGIHDDIAEVLAPDELQAVNLLYALGRYQPTSLADGPGSLARVAPYDAAGFAAALAAAPAVLHHFSAAQLSAIAAALAAAGHMQPADLWPALSEAAARALQASAPPCTRQGALAELKTLAWLSTALARTGQRDVSLLEQLALRGEDDDDVGWL